MPAGASAPRKMDHALAKALARAFRWKRLLDSGAFTSVTEIAGHDKLSFTYISRVLRLACLRPISSTRSWRGKSPRMMLADLLDAVPAEWQTQRALWLLDGGKPDGP